MTKLDAFLHVSNCRLTPSYMVVIFFYCTLMSRIGDGPLWDSKIKLEQERCQKSWWTNLLYVNNYVKTEHMVGMVVASKTLKTSQELLLVYVSIVVLSRRLPPLHHSPADNIPPVEVVQSWKSYFGN
jgi:hypothetical protein